MKVLVACEFSGIVREAFLAKGHYAMSCDLLPTEQGYYHYKGDVLTILDQGWDLMLAFPPCTYITNSGVRWLYNKDKSRNLERWQQMADGARFFLHLLRAPIARICVENPIMHKYAIDIIGRRQDQCIQPWEFGHDASKRTCLWLKDLPPLEPTDIVKRPKGEKYANQTPSGQNKLGPSPDRWKDRSRTYTGIAKAMADQWG